MRKRLRYVRLYFIFIAQYIKTMMQSKIDFFIGLSGFLISQSAGIAFLYLVFEQIPSMNNWSFEQMLFIYGFAQIPRGLDHFFTDNLWLVAGQMVIEGSFDKYLLRPMNLFFQIICERIQLDAVGELLIGILLVARAIRNGTVEVTLFKGIFFLVSIVAGSVIYTAVKLFFAAMAFWVKDSMPFLNTAYEVADFAKYPIEIYSKPIQLILLTILPFAFVAYIPATFFLVDANLLRTIGAECVVAALIWWFSYSLFRRGLTRYESAGN